MEPKTNARVVEAARRSDDLQLRQLFLTDPMNGERLLFASELKASEDGTCSFEVANKHNTRRWKVTFKMEEV